jgi:hypothetical protein
MTTTASTRARRAIQLLALWVVACHGRAIPGEGGAQQTVVTVFPSPATVPPGAKQPFSAAVTGSGSPSVVWSVQQGTAGGSISSTGLYTAPATPGTYVVVATEPVSGVSGQAQVTVDTGCWQLLPVDRARLYPRAGQEAAMVGGTIQGSNDSATNGFTVLATVSSVPAAGQWTELTFQNAMPYRYVKYYGPPNSYGQIAEVEFHGGATRLTGAGFGTAGSRSGNPWQNALDGNTATVFDGATPSDDYVGLDLAAGHVVATPVISPPGGSFGAPQSVAITTSTAGATIRYTTDGSDPATGGIIYTGPFQVAATSTVRTVASASCMQASDAAMALFTIGGPPLSGQASLHIGNSLTDTIDSGFLLSVATSGGVNLDYARYTVPGAGTWLYHENPTGGVGVANVQTTVATRRLDHISFQPFPNMPCLPTGGDATPGSNASDATNIDEAWNTAVTLNAGVQMWVYEAWPPTPTEGYTNCITGGAWLRDPTIWNTTPPTSWEDAESHELAYMEAVRAGLVSMHPTRTPPYIIPAGRAIAKLKQAVEAGRIPGVATSAFWTTYFSNNGTDNHLTDAGRYVVALVFYSSMFQRDPRALADTNLGTPATVTAAQAAAYQQIAWDTVTTYALSGFGR